MKSNIPTLKTYMKIEQSKHKPKNKLTINFRKILKGITNYEETLVPKKQSTTLTPPYPS